MESERPAYGIYLADRRAVAGGSLPLPSLAEPTREEPLSGPPASVKTTAFSERVAVPRKANETPGRADHRL